MAKRFTDTDKYKKGFHRSLPGAYKLFWDYLYHDCNHAGIWHVDMEVAQLYIGKDMPIDKDKALELFNADEERIVILKGGSKWFIKPFIDFQYGELNPSVKLHSSVISLLSKEGIKPFANSLQTVKDKNKDKDKDKNKVKEEDSLGKSENPFLEIIQDLNEKTEKNYKLTPATKTLIKARLGEGFNIDDFKKVHENMAAKWKADPKMNQYLRPSTLYQASKFEGYVNTVVSLSDRGLVSPRTEKNIHVMNNWLAKKKEEGEREEEKGAE